jgi:hypothetical protein
MAVAVSMARQFGPKALAAPSAGNAGGALAAYAARDKFDLIRASEQIMFCRPVELLDIPEVSG